MSGAEPLVELWRGDFLESVHLGHAVICDATGDIVHAWGDPDQVILPRSSCKMLQALPLITSGAADAVGLTTEQLALACASHSGGAMHVDRVSHWLGDLGLDEDALMCGAQHPDDPDESKRLTCGGHAPGQVHNNCSGKHAGFLTLARHLGADPDYINPDHPVQTAARTSFEEATGTPGLGYGIDGCSAPNFATTLHGLARAMAECADPRNDLRGKAQKRLVQAMMTHPELVAGQGMADTILMRAAAGMAAVKTGAEGVYIGILPGVGMGFAVKIQDGTTRAAECVAAALLVRLGILDIADAAIRRFVNAPILNRRDIVVGEMRPVGIL